MTTWETERAQLLTRLLEAETGLQAVLASSSILHRVRQSAQRAIEQVQGAKQQLREQEASL